MRELLLVVCSRLFISTGSILIHKLSSFFFLSFFLFSFFLSFFLSFFGFFLLFFSVHHPPHTESKNQDSPSKKIEFSLANNDIAGVYRLMATRVDEHDRVYAHDGSTASAERMRREGLEYTKLALAAIPHTHVVAARCVLLFFFSSLFCFFLLENSSVFLCFF